MRIAIFGGSFDPIHKGHEQIVRQALTVCDRVDIVPCSVSRYEKQMAKYKHRHTMCSIAFQSFGALVTVRNTEAVFNIKGRTYKLMEKHREENPNDELYCVIGADSLEKMSDWYMGRELITKCPMVIIERPEHPYKIAMKDGDYFLNNVHSKDISSTEIKRLMSEGKYAEVSEMMNPKVLNYIYDNRLYKGEK